MAFLEQMEKPEIDHRTFIHDNDIEIMEIAMGRWLKTLRSIGKADQPQSHQGMNGHDLRYLLVRSKRPCQNLYGLVGRRGDGHPIVVFLQFSDDARGQIGFPASGIALQQCAWSILAANAVQNAVIGLSLAGRELWFRARWLAGPRNGARPMILKIDDDGGHDDAPEKSLSGAGAAGLCRGLADGMSCRRRVLYVAKKARSVSSPWCVGLRTVGVPRESLRPMLRERAPRIAKLRGCYGIVSTRSPRKILPDEKLTKNNQMVAARHYAKTKVSRSAHTIDALRRDFEGVA